MISKIVRFVVLLALVCAFSRPVSAQSVYIIGAIGADISRSGRMAVDGFSSGGGGEALSGALRVGVVPHERWGIELEIAKSGEFTQRADIQGSPRIPDIVFPNGFPVVSGFEQRQRTMTISTAGSARQRISDSVDLVYLGGVVFYRVTDETHTTQVFRGLLIPPPGFGRDLSFDSVTVLYGAGPVAGFEAHIGLGEHVKMVPGIRMHGVRSSWLLRPSVGLGWEF